MRTIGQGIVIKANPSNEWVLSQMREIGVDPRGMAIMADKFEHLVVRLNGLDYRQAAIIKQEMLARGAEAAVSWEICSQQGKEVGPRQGALLSGTLRQFKQLVAKLKLQPFGLPELAQRINQALVNYDQFQNSGLAPLEIKGKIYDLQSRTHLMGIINLTPDSFSKDGLYQQTKYIDLALEQAAQMIAAGADFLDLGAESSRPGAVRVDATEEWKRLFPVLKELVGAVQVPISVDTYKPEIAQQALELGATIINDIWGLQAPDDPEHRMAKVVAAAKVPVVIMHNKTNSDYAYLMPEIIDSLQRAIDLALDAGVAFEKIIVDPGIGFAKGYQENLRVLRDLAQLKVLGRPILLGTSRKSVVGLTLDLPAAERLEGTIATAVWGASQGANIIRVHDVMAHYRALKMGDAIAKG